MPPHDPATPPDDFRSPSGNPADSPAPSPDQVFTKRAARQPDPPSSFSTQPAANAVDIDASLRKLQRTIKITALILVILSGITVVILYNLFAYQSSKATPPPTLKDPASASPESQTAITSVSNRIPELRTVVEKFSAATSVEDLLPICRDIDRTEPLMRDFYDRNPFNPVDITAFAIGDSLVVEEDADSGNEFVYVGFETSDFNSKVVCLEIVDNEFKIDWESAVGYCEMDWSDFHAHRPTTPTLFRVVALPTDYHNYEFSNAETWAAFSLLNGQGISQVYGFVKRNSPQHRQIIKAFRKAKSAWLILRLKYPENARSSSCAEITEVIHDRWVIGYLHAETPS
ncbi:MAG: hypothetical protein AAF591_22715, partial [Verrucomicrobiota bacterium]